MRVDRAKKSLSFPGKWRYNDRQVGDKDTQK